MSTDDQRHSGRRPPTLYEHSHVQLPNSRRNGYTRKSQRAACRNTHNTERYLQNTHRRHQIMYLTHTLQSTDTRTLPACTHPTTTPPHTHLHTLRQRHIPVVVHDTIDTFIITIRLFRITIQIILTYHSTKSCTRIEIIE